MHAIAPAACRIEALALEAGWARTLQKAGFELENEWGEHAARSNVAIVPLIRLLRLTVHFKDQMPSDASKTIFGGHPFRHQVQTAPFERPSRLG